ncbi:MAG: S-layer homology domain-containing protein, partial [Clostridia bacterium]
VQYKDMDGHPAEAVVAYARSMGITDGYEDGYFYPDDPVTYEQAIKMIIGALGYDYYATADGGYPSGYLKVANNLKLTSGVGLTVGSYITRGDVAKIVYNSLTVDLMEGTEYSGANEVTYEIIEGKNLLNTYFDVEKLRGTIDETGFTSLLGETSLEENEVRIGNEIFDVGTTNIASYIGYYVTFYALETDDSDKRVIISYKVESSKNNYIKIDAENIENVEITTNNYLIEYRNNINDKTTKRVKISSTPYVIYNGVALPDYTLDDFDPDYGQLTLLDSDGNGTYDLVDILSYDIMLVLSSSSASGNVSSVYTTGARSVKLDEDDEDYTVRLMDGDGNKVSFNQINKNTVLHVALSKDEGQTVRTAIVSNATVNGTIKSITDDGKYVINGTAYEAIGYMKNLQTMAIGDSGNFFLTYDGRIAGFDGESKLSKNIGMFISWNEGGYTDGGDVIKIMHANGSFGTYNLASTVKLNGVSYRGKDVFKWISDASSTNPIFGDDKEPLFGSYDTDRKTNKIIARPERAGILYKLNSDGKISEITMVTAKNSANDEIHVITRGRSRTNRDNYNDSLYYSTKYHCFHRSDNKVYVTDGTVVFMSADNYTKTDDSQIYSATTPASMWNNQYFQYYEAYFYYVEDREYADFAVFYDDYDAEASSSLETDYSRYTMYDKIRIVDRIIERYNEDNDIIYQLVYWEGGSLKYVDFHEDVNERYYYRDGKNFWRRGDMVRFVKTNNKITAIASIFDSGYTGWNDPVGNEVPGEDDIVGGKNSYNKYKFPIGSYVLWGNSSYYSNIVQRHYVGRVVSINSMKYFSTLDLTTSTDTLSGEPIEGDCYRFDYDNRGYIVGVDNVGNGAIAEGQLVLVRKNGSNGQIGCRIAETYILYDYDEVPELIAYMEDAYAANPGNSGLKTNIERIKNIYPEFSNLNVNTAELSELN